MSEASKEHPFKTLGSKLKRLRVKHHQTLAEVSGAVEIDSDTLQSIEIGKERPGEDILLLLMSHFAAKDDEATTLWDLAGYDQEELPESHMMHHAHGQVNNMLVMANETPVVYTDMVHIMVNNYGVVMNFMQTAVATNQPMAVARIGMSREHAQSVLEVLQKTLALSAPKLLPATKPPKKSKE